MPDTQSGVSIGIPVAFGALTLLIIVVTGVRRYRRTGWGPETKAGVKEPCRRSRLQYADLEASRGVPPSPKQSTLSPYSADSSTAHGSALSVLKTPPGCHLPADDVSRGHQSLEVGAPPVNAVPHSPAKSYTSPSLRPPPASTSPAPKDPFADDAAELPDHGAPAA